MTFEFDLEVRPQFDLPQWKGLQIEKPVREFTDADVDQALKRILTNRGSLVPVDGPAEPGDYITTNLTFKYGDQVLSSATEEVIRLRPVLSFRDGKIEGFDQADDRRPRRRDPRIDHATQRRRSQRGPSRAAGHGRLRSAGSQEAAIAGIDPGPAAGPGRIQARGRPPRRDQGHARPAPGVSAAAAGPRADHGRVDRGRQLGVAARSLAAAEPPRVAARGHGVAAQRFRRGRNPRPRKRLAAEQPRLDRPGLEGTLHPRADRRGPADRRRRKRLRCGNRHDRQADQRVAAAGAGPLGEAAARWTCCGTRSSSGRWST